MFNVSIKKMSLIAAALCGPVILAACSSEPTCDYSKEEYMSATSVPSLRAPDGLTTPDRSNSLVIPDPPAGAKIRPPGKGACLDRPPSYFSTKPAVPANVDKTAVKPIDPPVTPPPVDPK